jgi:hypothetical protein
MKNKIQLKPRALFTFSNKNIKYQSDTTVPPTTTIDVSFVTPFSHKK